MAMANGEFPSVSPTAGPPPPESSAPQWAWQPVTPRGVAAFARAPFSRLLLVEGIFVSLAVGAMVWFLAAAWFPVIREAIAKLPEQGVIRNGELTSPRLASGLLAEGTFLAMSVGLDRRGSATPTADVHLEFRQRQYLVCSLLGCLAFDYPKNWIIEFNRKELEPWWGAWEPILLALTALFSVGGLGLLWALLATLYCWVPRAVAFFTDRELSWAGSWRLASAALLPGTLVMTFALLLYGLGVLDLIRFGIVATLHLLVGWVYLVLSPLSLAQGPVAERIAKNPFATKPADTPGPPPPGQGA